MNVLFLSLSLSITLDFYSSDMYGERTIGRDRPGGGIQDVMMEGCCHVSSGD